MPKTKKNAEGSSRIHCRISSTLKERVERAAELCGQSITSFTELALAEKAQDVLDQEERIQLSQSAFQTFKAILEAPPEPPSAKLIAAIEDYKQQRSQ